MTTTISDARFAAKFAEPFGGGGTRWSTLQVRRPTLAWGLGGLDGRQRAREHLRVTEHGSTGVEFAGA
jgi:hypothetical protein